MTLHPHIQARVRSEIDAVIGHNRFPSLGDRGVEKMPYLEATLLESMRWHPPVSSIVPHLPIRDDTFRGYFIPKGTTIIANAWAISRDPAHFESPSSFKPERFLDEDDSSSTPTVDPRHFVFGFGRRICPGMDLALHSLWMGVALTLWAFEIKLRDEDASEMKNWGDRERFTFGNTR
ncbi:hypothetical protein M407DRAFT_70289 [Tulasnella calospora MUT 4182]|uniref:Cytochrome P450 n=1 Tax=Tulasnella calospora MUT 4182 TaxID=1051891 RepID=A0A0C3L6Y7_9AGAM|nr:hypothetical protein M407DRAFT_70289 [Tulasnella calospora MUT 4182]